MKKSFLLFLVVLISHFVQAQNDFITRWDLSYTGSNPNSITFGVGTTGTVNYTWETIPAGTSGIGSFSGTSANIAGLPSNAIIRLKINPTNFNRININHGLDKYRLIDVEQWGTTNWTTMNSAFYGCNQLNITSTDIPDLSGVTNLTRMFYLCNSLNGPSNIGTWNTSSVTNMDSMFINATSFNQPIGNWNTSNVTNMTCMFYSAVNFNQPIGNWNTSNVNTMNHMFTNAPNFNQPIGNWNTSNVTSMGNMFLGALSFNQPLGNWNTGNVTNMSAMFNFATNFNQPIDNWNTGNVADMSSMFQNATSFNQPIGNWNTSNVTTLHRMFYGTSSFNQPIGNWNTSNVNTMNHMFFNATSFNQPIGNWNTSNVNDVVGMFFNATSFNQPIGNWNTGNVTNMYRMFFNATSFNQPISNWNTSNVTSMAYLFSGATSFNQPLGNWNLISINITLGTELMNMLDNCGMDCFNYSATLSGWANNSNSPININLGATNLYYNTIAQIDRNYLINSLGWTILGDALNNGNCCTTQFTNINHTTCSSYFFNNQTLISSGIYMDTLLNVLGCDSVITLNLTINQPTSYSYNYSSCSSYFFNNQTLTSSGIYYDTLQNISGCDSIITLNLTINSTSSTSFNQSVCNSYFFNNQTLTTSGTYYDTLINTNGCDSLITLYLTINQPSNYSYNYSTCSAYFFNNQILSISGIYKDTLLNALSCDSIVTLNLTILPNIPVYQTINITTCNSYFFNNQNIYTNGTYYDTLINTIGCDSIVTLNLTIINANNTVSQNGTLLTALASGSTYQWLLCNPYTPIAFATNQTYNVVFNGSYAVAQTHPNGCTDTSNCITVNSVGIDEVNNNNSKRITVYPNPSNGNLIISTASNFNNATIKIIALTGQTILQKNNCKGKQIDIDISHFSNGIYFAEITDENKTSRMKISKE